MRYTFKYATLGIKVKKKTGKLELIRGYSLAIARKVLRLDKLEIGVCSKLLGTIRLPVLISQTIEFSFHVPALLDHGS